MIIFDRDELVYLGGRAASLVSRPAYLLVCNHFFGNRPAAVVASIILIATMLGALSAADTHRLYYARHFGTADGSVARAYSRYVFSILLVSLVGAAACMTYFLAVEHSLALALSAALFFVSERLADEVLRFTLFQRRRATWGILMLKRVATQALLLMAIGLIASPLSGPRIGALFALALFLGNAAAFGGYLPIGLLGRCLNRPMLFTHHLKGAARLIGRSGIIWILSMAAAVGGYVDRLIVLAARKEDLAIFTLIVVSMSLIQNAVEYFYFSQRRRDFLEGAIDFRDVLLSRSFQGVLFGSLACGALLTFVNIHLYRNAPHVPIMAILLVAIVQIALSSTSIVREIAYWNNQFRSMLRVETAFLAMISAIFLTLYFAEPHYVWLLGGAAAALVVRLYLFTRISPARIPIS